MFRVICHSEMDNGNRVLTILTFDLNPISGENLLRGNYYRLSYLFGRRDLKENKIRLPVKYGS